VNGSAASGSPIVSHGTLFGDAGYGIVTIREKAVTTVAPPLMIC
jgi:hypothetical protein